MKTLHKHFSVATGDYDESLCCALGRLLRAVGLNPGGPIHSRNQRGASHFREIEVTADLINNIGLIFLSVFALLLYSIILPHDYKEREEPGRTWFA